MYDILIANGVVFYVYQKKRRRRLDDEQILGTLKSLPGTPREYSFKELKKATNNFSPDCLLGSGAFGTVYKGTFELEGILAIKRAHGESFLSKAEFINGPVLI